MSGYRVTIENFETKMDDSYKDFLRNAEDISIDHINKEVKFAVLDTNDGSIYRTLNKLNKDLNWSAHVKLQFHNKPNIGYKLKLHDPLMAGHEFTSANEGPGVHRFKISFTLCELVES